MVRRISGISRVLKTQAKARYQSSDADDGFSSDSDDAPHGSTPQAHRQAKEELSEDSNTYESSGEEQGSSPSSRPFKKPSAFESVISKSSPLKVVKPVSKTLAPSTPKKSPSKTISTPKVTPKVTPKGTPKATPKKKGVMIDFHHYDGYGILRRYTFREVPTHTRISQLIFNLPENFKTKRTDIYTVNSEIITQVEKTRLTDCGLEKGGIIVSQAKGISG